MRAQATISKHRDALNIRTRRDGRRYLYHRDDAAKARDAIISIAAAGRVRISESKKKQYANPAERDPLCSRKVTCRKPERLVAERLRAAGYVSAPDALLAGEV